MHVDHFIAIVIWTSHCVRRMLQYAGKVYRRSRTLENFRIPSICQKIPKVSKFGHFPRSDNIILPSVKCDTPFMAFNFLKY